MDKIKHINEQNSNAASKQTTSERKQDGTLT